MMTARWMIFAVVASANLTLLLIGWWLSQNDTNPPIVLAVAASLIPAMLAASLVRPSAPVPAQPPQPSSPEKPATNTSEVIMERMASLLAHDLCNALSAVKVNLQILERQVGANSRQHAERCRMALDQVRQIESTIGDLQSFARPMGHEKHETDLRDTINSVLLDCLASIDNKGIRVARREDSSLPRLVVDRLRLAQALRQVLDNAIEACSNNGQITVTTRSSLTQSDTVEIEVSDDGCGMTEETRIRATEPFFTTKSRGSGLGLAIAERVTIRHGGALSIVSYPEKGTSVILQFPVNMG